MGVLLRLAWLELLNFDRDRFSSLHHCLPDQQWPVVRSVHLNPTGLDHQSNAELPNRMGRASRRIPMRSFIEDR